MVDRRMVACASSRASKRVSATSAWASSPTVSACPRASSPIPRPRDRHGFVDRDPERVATRSASACSSWARQRSTSGLHAVAPPQLEALSRSSGGTCHLAVLSGIEAVYVYKVDRQFEHQHVVARRRARPRHATSIGKILLAWAPPECRRGARAPDDRLHRQRRRRAPSSSTRSGCRACPGLRARPRGVRRRPDPHLPPSKSHTDKVIAALESPPRTRHRRPDGLRSSTPLVVAAARELSRNLGFAEHLTLNTAV